MKTCYTRFKFWFINYLSHLLRLQRNFSVCVFVTPVCVVSQFFTLNLHLARRVDLDHSEGGVGSRGGVGPSQAPPSGSAVSSLSKNVVMLL